ncbi:MAG: DUF2461 domain-containing protein [Bacteroidetes bacterium]|nr:DUF2461 domain-containing protein [Bacteroidota bacterium]
MFAFLRELKIHNDRAWFAAHRADYEHCYREPAVRFCQLLAARFEQAGLALVADPKRSPFRIYRDVRFSANKDPYKTHLGLYFPVRWDEEIGVYLHLEPENCFLAGGSWNTDAFYVRRLRRIVAERYRELEGIVRSPEFRAWFQIRGERISRLPTGYPSDHPAREWLLHKQLYAWTALEESTATRPEVMDWTLARSQTLWPLLELLAPRP